METSPNNITVFRGPNFYLSNFYPCTVRIGSLVFPSSEHAFQAQKSLFLDDQEYIRDAPSPQEAKRRGRNLTRHKIVLRPDWDTVAIPSMKLVSMAKYSQHPDLRAKLLATGELQLIEGNWWGDTFWGMCDGKGSNWHGITLMEVRADLAARQVENVSLTEEDVQ